MLKNSFFSKLLKSKHTYLLPYLFIISVWLVFVIPYYFSNKTPFPSTYQVNSFPPWSDYPKYWGPVKNGAMPDIIVQIFPWKHFSIESLKSGILPLWNPYSFSGNPNLANFQTAALSPFNILFFFLPFLTAWDLLIFLPSLLTGLFMYIFMRSFKISEIGSLFSSISFMFCGFMVAWMAYGTLSYAIAFLPLVLYGINKYQETNKIKFAFIFAFAIALSVFSGHFQTSLYLLIFSFFYLLFRAFFYGKRNFMIFLPFIAGIMLSFPQILPSVEFYLNSTRSEIFIKSGGIPIQYLITLFSPDFYGNPVTRNDWFGYYAEWASFVGVIPLILAFYALFKRSKNSAFFIGAFIVTSILVIDSPVQQIIGSLKIPVLSTSTPSRVIVLLSFSLTVLSGMGFDSLKKLIAERKKVIFIPIFIFVIIVFTIGVGIFFAHLIPDSRLIISKRNLVIPVVLFLLLAFIVIVSFLQKNKKILVYFSILLLILTSFDSLRYVKKWMPYDPKNLAFIDLPVLKAMKNSLGHGRVFGNLEAQVGTYYEIPLIEGYDPLYIGRYGEFIRSAASGRMTEGERSVVKLDRQIDATDRVLDTLGVAIVFNPIADTHQSWAYPVWNKTNKYDLIYRDEKFELFKNKNPIGRPSLFFDYEVVSSDGKTISKFYDKNFDFKKRLILDKKPTGLIGINGKGNSSIEKETPNYIKILTNSTTPSLLFLSDNFYPGWRVFVNGNERKILRADYSFRAVEVPNGKSIVEFRYQPQSLYIGFYIAGLGFLLLIMLGITNRFKRV